MNKQLAELLKEQPLSTNRKALEPALEPIRSQIRNYTNQINDIEKARSIITTSHKERSVLVDELNQLNERIDAIRESLRSIDRQIASSDQDKQMVNEIRRLSEEKRHWQNKYNLYLPSEIAGEYPFKGTDLFPVVFEWEQKVQSLLQELYPSRDFKRLWEISYNSTEDDQKYIGGGEYESIEGTHFINAVKRYIEIIESVAFNK